MREFHGAATTRVSASAREVFDLITDLDRLPEWNQAIERILEHPEALTPGAEWVVVMHPSGTPRWKSRSHLEEIEPCARLVYRSHSEDTNPSYARWQWDITPAHDGVQVTVSWDAHPKTMGRRLLAARIRRRMLAREVPESLEALAGALRSREPS